MKVFKFSWICLVLFTICNTTTKKSETAGIAQAPTKGTYAFDANFLKKHGGTGNYKETTCHFQGGYDELKQPVKQLPGVDLDKMKK